MKKILSLLAALTILSGLWITQVAPALAAVGIDADLRPDYAAQ